MRLLRPVQIGVRLEENVLRLRDQSILQSHSRPGEGISRRGVGMDEEPVFTILDHALQLFHGGFQGSQPRSKLGRGFSGQPASPSDEPQMGLTMTQRQIVVLPLCEHIGEEIVGRKIARIQQRHLMKSCDRLNVSERPEKREPGLSVGLPGAPAEIQIRPTEREPGGRIRGIVYHGRPASPDGEKR